MTIENAINITNRATINKYAIGAFNITSFVQMKAIIETNAAFNVPVIVQVSVSPSKFYTPEVVASVYRTMAASVDIPVCLHLDHCTNIDFCKRCADAGYTNIMFDGSKLSFIENIRQTKDVVDYCHKIGISVEGELGTVSGVEDQVKVVETEAELCNPDQVFEFVEGTGIDLFAPAIGTAHGIYKTKDPKIDLDRFGRIFNMLNQETIRTPLVVHGGTGLPETTVRHLIELGGSKFNVSTDLKHNLIDTTYKYISSHQNEYEPGKIDAEVKDATCQLVTNWIKLFSSTRTSK